MVRFTQKLAEDVVSYREMHKLSQAAFGELVGLSQSSVVRLERGRLPRRQTLERISDLIYGKEASESRARETPSQYGEKSNHFIHWAADILAADIPHVQKVRMLRDAADIELARISGVNKRTAGDAS